MAGRGNLACRWQPEPGPPAPAALQDQPGADAAARQLTTRQAVADVWPLVEPLLLDDLQHIAKHRGASAGWLPGMRAWRLGLAWPPKAN